MTSSPRRRLDTKNKHPTEIEAAQRGLGAHVQLLKRRRGHHFNARVKGKLVLRVAEQADVGQEIKQRPPQRSHGGEPFVVAVVGRFRPVLRQRGFHLTLGVVLP